MFLKLYEVQDSSELKLVIQVIKFKRLGNKF